MAVSDLPLSYCTNVHPGRTLAEVIQGLDDFAAPVAQRCGGTVAAGLWLAAQVIRELLDSPAGISQLKETLQRGGLTCHTLNAFPYGDFHSARVKENVYLPDWADPRRLEYTVDCARVLTSLMPAASAGRDLCGSISTMPLGFKERLYPSGHREACISQLLEAVEQLARIESGTGRTIRLAIEPEPFCLLETTAETVRFFQDLFHRAEQSRRGDLARKYLGVCYDVCHQAVEFEEIAASVHAFQDAGIRINKLHITCALELENPGENLPARETLARFAEPRYLHQTLALRADGSILRNVDLTSEWALHPPEEFLSARSWRIHFHVPVDAEQIGTGAGALGTTRRELRQARAAVAELPYAPHLEVETYTWPVLPGDGECSGRDLVEGLSRELLATQQLLSGLPRVQAERPAR